jgi:hypothetical protein
MAEYIFREGRYLMEKDTKTESRTDNPSIYQWCKEKPERFEQMRKYLLENHNKWYGAHQKLKCCSPVKVPNDWPFERSLFGSAVLLACDHWQVLKDAALFDAVLFYNHYVSYSLTLGTIAGKPWKLKTFNKLRPYLAESESVRQLYLDVKDILDLTTPYFTVKDFLERAKCHSLQHFSPMSNLDWVCDMYVGKENTNSYAWNAIDYFTIPALRRIGNTLKAMDGIHGMPMPAERFTSLKQAKKAHDEWMLAEKERLERQMDMLRIPYHYEKELVEIVEKHGWYLPKTPADMLQRGYDHHNCVGSYEVRQNGCFPATYNRRDYSTRNIVIFNDEASAELSFRSQGYVLGNEGAVITSGRVIQCKGKYNKDMNQNGLEGIINDLRGLDAYILSVYKE